MLAHAGWTARLQGALKHYHSLSLPLAAVDYDRQNSEALTSIIQLTRTRLGDRSFAVSGPRLCNSLPDKLRDPIISLGHFRRALKTHLFLN